MNYIIYSGREPTGGAPNDESYLKIVPAGRGGPPGRMGVLTAFKQFTCSVLSATEVKLSPNTAAQL